MFRFPKLALAPAAALLASSLLQAAFAAPLPGRQADPLAAQSQVTKVDGYFGGYGAPYPGPYYRRPYSYRPYAPGPYAYAPPVEIPYGYTRPLFGGYQPYYNSADYFFRPAAPLAYYSAPGPGPFPPDAVAACAERFRSFDPRTGTYVTYWGEVVLCPYLR